MRGVQRGEEGWGFLAWNLARPFMEFRFVVFAMEFLPWWLPSYSMPLDLAL